MSGRPGSECEIPFVDLITQYDAIGGQVAEAVAEVMKSGDFIEGHAVNAFEMAFSQFVGTSTAVGVSSGYDALELALAALGIGAGDEVVLPANSFIASAFAVMAVGAVPVLVDCREDTYGIDPAAVDAAITENSRAIMPVHLTGQPAEMDPLLAIARRYGLRIVEDVAQAHGARYRGRVCGSIGDVGCFSFYPGKNLGAYGDGGAVTTSSPEIANLIRQRKNFGQTIKSHHLQFGRNARLDSLQAAVLSVKLKYLDQWNAARKRNAEIYRHRLAGSGDLRFQKTADNGDHVYHLFVVETEFRNALQVYLQERSIRTGIHYPTPIHLQPACADLAYRRGDFPVTEALSQRMLSLPMFPELTVDQIERIADAIQSFFVDIKKSSVNS